jgi:hypothetical protein
MVKRDGRGVLVAIMTMVGKGRRRLRWLFSDNARIAGGDGRYPGAVVYHPIHSVLNVIFGGGRVSGIRGIDQDCGTLPFAILAVTLSLLHRMTSP